MNRPCALTRRLSASCVAITLLLPVWCGAAESLRVCADPDNLPFSNEKQQGVDNQIAAILAKDMNATLSYTWLKQRQNFFRQTLGAHRCDVVMAVPVGFNRVLATRPYYRSSYVMVTKKSRNLHISSYEDPVLKDLRIGLHVIGNDGSNVPPAVALGRYGLAKNIVGFSMWGEGSVKDPQGLVIKAVADGQIDVAIVWGPIGGYFASKYRDTLAVVPAPNDPNMPELLFSYDMAMGVRKDDTELAAKLEATLERHRSEIRHVLLASHIPVIEPVRVSATLSSESPLNTSLKNEQVKRL